jgi:hypothetical protein
MSSDMKQMAEQTVMQAFEIAIAQVPEQMAVEQAFEEALEEALRKAQDTEMNPRPPVLGRQKGFKRSCNDDNDVDDNDEKPNTKRNKAPEKKEDSDVDPLLEAYIRSLGREDMNT